MQRLLDASHRLSFLAHFTLLGFAAAAHAAGPLPQDGNFVAGAGMIRTQGGTLDIKQISPRAVIDWRSFSIGKGNSVNVDNGSGATLSRVSGAAASLIDGRLNASGSFYLVNPQGVLIGPSGIVTTGGRFVASALDIDRLAFMKGGALTLDGDGCGAVVNLGAISSSGGDVFLISRTTTVNAGSIDAPRGTAELAAGGEVLLKDSASGPQVFVQPGSHGKVIDKGAIDAAQISLQAADGNVFALAGRRGELRATGTAQRDGRVWLVADKGEVSAHGHIVASNADGTGGTVEFRARTFDLDYASVDAAQWHLHAPSFIAGPHKASTIARNLSRGTSVTVDAADPHGDIAVLSDLRWSGNASLTLNAGHSVWIGRNVTVANTGGGNLTLRADAAGIDNAGSAINRGLIDWSKSTGTVAALYDMNGRYAAGGIRVNPGWHAAPYSGLRTQVTAYKLINSIADLKQISSDLSGAYALGKNIAPAEGESGRVRIATAADSTFNGQLDGMGHEISGLSLLPLLDDGSSDDYGALFPTIGKSGIVRNIGIVDSGAGAINSPIALLAGDNQGLIVNVHATGSVISDGIATSGGGGLVVNNDGVIARSSVSASFGYQGSFGGMAQSNDGLIVQSFADSDILGGTHSYGGGLVNSNAGTIRQSYATGSIGTLENGGIAEYNSGRIEQSFVTANVGPGGYPEWSGAIAAGNYGTITGDVFWDRTTTGQDKGVGSGTLMPAANGLTSAQMSNPASFGPTWDFGPNGVWAMPAGAAHPVLHWQLAQ
jgi:filamentous hemagglutinin family protein